MGDVEFQLRKDGRFYIRHWENISPAQIPAQKLAGQLAVEHDVIAALRTIQVRAIGKEVSVPQCADGIPRRSVRLFTARCGVVGMAERVEQHRSRAQKSRISAGVVSIKFRMPEIIVGRRPGDDLKFFTFNAGAQK